MARNQWKRVAKVDEEVFFAKWETSANDTLLSWNRDDGITVYRTFGAQDFVVFDHELYFTAVNVDTGHSGAIFHINPNEKDIDRLSNQDFTNVWDIEAFNDALVFVGYSGNNDTPRLAYLDQSGFRHDLDTHGYFGSQLKVDGDTLHVDDGITIDGLSLTVDRNWNVTPDGILFV